MPSLENKWSGFMWYFGYVVLALQEDEEVRLVNSFLGMVTGRNPDRVLFWFMRQAGCGIRVYDSYVKFSIKK